MKNQIIKKIMAYLLVGAMVISTPISASASELENAYATDKDENNNPINNSKTGTSTSTNTATQSIDLPEEIAKNLPSIIGIALDKTSLEFGKNEATSFLQARALFDTYDASEEEMQWVTADAKQRIESEINWFSEDYNVATIGHVWNTWNGENVVIENDKVVTSENEDGSKTKQGNKAEIKAVGEGVTTIYAWIEADGLVYTNAPQRPTPGDYIAAATVTVREASIIKINDIKFNMNDPKVVKRQYDLTKYTTLEFKSTDANGKEKIFTKEVGQYSGSVVYGITKTSGAVKATLTDAGVLKITKGNPKDEITFSITTESGFSKEETIVLDTPIPVTKITVETSDKNISLDMGRNTNYNKEKKRVEVQATITVEPANTTDEITWVSNKKAIADTTDIGVITNDGKQTATIYATGVGKANITIKSTNGKSGKIAVKVDATPSDVSLDTTSTYTGKVITLPAVLTGENGEKLPVGKTKLKYTFVDEDSNDKAEGINVFDSRSAKKIASINNKGVLSPKLLLSTDGGKSVEDAVDVRVQVTATNGTWTDKDAANIRINQSSLKDLEIDTKQYQKNDNSDSNVWKSLSNSVTLGKDATKATLSNVYVGNTYKFVPTANLTNTDAKGDESSIVWTSTGKGVKSALSGKDYKSEITGSTNATIKATYVELTKQDNGRTKAQKKTKTITLKPIQMAKSLVLDKPIQVVNIGYKNGNVNDGKVLKDTTVTIKVKALDPKKSKDTIQWKVLTADATSTETIKNPISGVKIALTDKTGYAYVDNALVDKDGKSGSKVTDTAKNKTLKVTIPAGTEAGSVIKVGAYAQGGAVAYGYIYVTNPTKNILNASILSPATQTEKNGRPVKNNWDLKLNETAKVSADLGLTNNTTVENTKLESKWTTGDTSAYENEYLTYTLDKKGAQVIRIDKDGNITPMKVGKATITIKTASGKRSAKVTVNVTASAIQPNN